MKENEAMQSALVRCESLCSDPTCPDFHLCGPCVASQIFPNDELHTDMLVCHACLLRHDTLEEKFKWCGVRGTSRGGEGVKIAATTTLSSSEPFRSNKGGGEKQTQDRLRGQERTFRASQAPPETLRRLLKRKTVLSPPLLHGGGTANEGGERESFSALEQAIVEKGGEPRVHVSSSLATDEVKNDKEEGRDDNAKKSGRSAGRIAAITGGVCLGALLIGLGAWSWRTRALRRSSAGASVPMVVGGQSDTTTDNAVNDNNFVPSSSSSFGSHGQNQRGKVKHGSSPTTIVEQNVFPATTSSSSSFSQRGRDGNVSSWGGLTSSLFI